MEVQNVLHMNGGEGQTSYATNSTFQKIVISKAKSFVQEAILDLYGKTFPQKFTIADLGCSSGPNSLLVISDIIDAISTFCGETNQSSPEFQVYLNDLPGNDFNTVFKYLPSFYDKLKSKGQDSGSCFIAAVPASFYERVFPRESLCFVHSSMSLHWLSQVPHEIESNGRNIYITKTSPESVFKSYLKQFQKDFFVFLSSRSKEVIPGGRMVITMMGRRSLDPYSSNDSCSTILHLLAKALNDLVSQGSIEEAKLDSFNVPMYAPHVEEIRDLVQIEGSFHFESFKIFDVDWGVIEDDQGEEYVLDSIRSGQYLAKVIRAVAEPMLISHFGEAIIDALFCKYAEHVAEHLLKEDTKHVLQIICMTKKE